MMGAKGLDRGGPPSGAHVRDRDRVWCRLALASSAVHSIGLVYVNGGDLGLCTIGD